MSIQKRCDKCSGLMKRREMVKQDRAHPDNPAVLADRHEWECVCGNTATSFSQSTKQECAFKDCKQAGEVGVETGEGHKAKICFDHARDFKVAGS